MRNTALQSVVEARVERYEDELKSVLTISRCALMFEISPRTVRKHVEEGVLYAEKCEQSPFNIRSGFWLIPYSAAQDLYGKKEHNHEFRDESIQRSRTSGIQADSPFAANET